VTLLQLPTQRGRASEPTLGYTQGGKQSGATLRRDRGSSIDQI